MAIAAGIAVNGASFTQQGPQEYLSTIQNDSAMAQMGAGFDECADAGLDLDQTQAQVALKDSPPLAGKANKNTGYLEATHANYPMMKTDDKNVNRSNERRDKKFYNLNYFSQN